MLVKCLKISTIYHSNSRTFGNVRCYIFVAFLFIDFFHISGFEQSGNIIQFEEAKNYLIIWRNDRLYVGLKL